MLPTFLDSPSRRFSREAPAWGWGWPCCCSAVVNCVTGCASTGNELTGTATTFSGNECVDCPTSRIFDGFDHSGTASIGGLDPAWYTATSCGATAVYTRFTGTSSEGAMLNLSGGALLRNLTRPSLSGFCLEVRTRIVDVTPTGVAGITVPGGRVFFCRPLFSNYGRQACSDANGCIQAQEFQTFGAFGSGDTISIIFRDQGAGPTPDNQLTCTVCYLVNGVTVRLEENVICCFPDPLKVGLMVTLQADFDFFEVLTN